MSRLIVKNLPKHLTIERFREHFADKGEVTDAKFARTHDGRFRQFGYIGYKTDKEAKAALKYFNDSYIDTSKIQVEFAKALGDSSLARPWSRHSQGSSAWQKKNEAEEEALRERQERQELLRQQRAQTEKEVERKKNFLDSLYAEENDPKLKEFLEVMRPRSTVQGRTWANDDGGTLETPGGKKSKVQAKVVTVANRKTGGDGMVIAKTHVTFGDSDDELYDDLPSNKPEPAAEAEDAAEEVEMESPEGDNVVEPSAAHDNSMSDLEYLRSKMKDIGDADDLEVAEEKPSEIPMDTSSSAPVNSNVHADRAALFEDSGEHSARQDTASTPSTPAPSILARSRPIPSAGPPPPEIIADTGRLFLKNLPFSTTAEDLHKLFEKFGPLSEVHIPINKETKKPKGFAFILFLLPEHAVKAFTKLDGSIFQGRILEIYAGKEKPRAPEDESNPNSYKAQKERQRKANATNEFSWNSLFMNSDAVAEAMAKKLGVRKSEILNPDADNMAVRLALAETHVIAETKKYLEDAGIDLSAFEKRKTRSKTVILVKNIPHDTEEEELQSLFGKFGTLGRLLLPPTRTIALIEYLEPNEAKAAFNRLAYTKFKHLPLYLEYAPMDAFKAEYDAKAEAERKASKEAELAEPEASPEPDSPTDSPIDSPTAPPDGASKPLVSLPETSSAEVEDADAMPVATLFVKNLNFDTTEESLHQTFSVARGLRSVRIATKPDNKTGGKLSMGFGFLEFQNKEDAMRCVKSMQNHQLDGHVLQLKYSNAAAKSTTQSKKRGSDDPIKVTGTKLIVRNIPFEATKRDVRQLFSSFGQVKSVRIPSKMDGQHRGFGFVDFLTKQEAKAAFESLAATHLYGRHLVLEWAQDEESVDAMRDKTAKGYFKDESNKKRRITLDEVDEET